VEKRQQEQRLLNQVINNKQEPGIQALLLLLTLRLQDSKDNLLGCLPADFPVAQAKAKAIRDLLQEITAPRV